MTKKLYVIYDRIAEESGPIREYTNDGLANRWLEMTMAEHLNEAWFHETDFILMHIGTVDKNTNIITPCDPHEVVKTLHLIEEIKDAESV